jgi:hypothetical protein
MVDRVLELRYVATCSHCGGSLTPGARGWWNSDSRAVTCTVCRPADADPLPTVTTPTGRSSREPVAGIPYTSAAGGSAHDGYLRRRQRREPQIERTWGPLSGVVKFLSDDPPSTKAWEKGAEGERKGAARLVRSVGEKMVILNDRRIPGTRSNIDHLVVAPTGVWIIDAKRYRGRVEQRNLGGWLKSDRRLFVGGRDRSGLASGLLEQSRAVLTALDGVALDVDVMAALCFVDSEWALFSKPFLQAGVLITWPKMLCAAISGPGPLRREQMHYVAECLAASLPTATTATQAGARASSAST